jgi:hypothetical protein
VAPFLEHAAPFLDTLTRAQYSFDFGWVDFGNPGDAFADYVNVTMASGQIITDALRWNGGRRDIFGTTHNGTNAWQAYFP